MTSALIKAELKSAGLTLEDLADFTEIPVERLREIIEGGKKLTVSEGIVIAQFFDLNPMILLGGTR
jgi:plasmid maintenance system antidote protein VapI